MTDHPHADRVASDFGKRRVARIAGTAGRRFGEILIVAGVLALIWVFVVWKWGDPVTAFYASRAQDRLGREYIAVEQRFTPRMPSQTVRARSAAQVLRDVRDEGRAYRAGLAIGDPVGTLAVPRLDLDIVVVNGTDTDTLKLGPGREVHTFVPGEHELVYVAGHRTTYGAPFAHIERLTEGDVIRFDLPYAHFTYRVTGHRIVGADAIEVLRSRGVEQLTLQACHPRFFATHRYLVDARLVKVAVPTTKAHNRAAARWRTYRVAANPARMRSPAP